MSEKLELKKYCHINTNQEADRFVGIKIDTDEIKVCFPIGYQLPEEENEIKKDIIHLLQVLSEFSKSVEGLIVTRKFTKKQKVDFPINAYLDVIQYFMGNKGYYSEKNAVYKTRKCGDIDWTRTIKEQMPSTFHNKIPMYTDYTVRESVSNYNELITKINKYCVYESFSKLGWLFTTYMPEKPDIPFDKRMFISVINKKLTNTNNDKEKMLFTSMKDIIECIDERSEARRLYYGTNNFELVWEKMIDKAFGIKNKQDYFPKTRWILRYGENRINHNLEPDTIMKYNNKIYVLDAKYYKYGITTKTKDLPDSSSINKQITYGEYVYNKYDMKNECLYNAFLMPFNVANNSFNLHNIFENIGTAVGEWNDCFLNYQQVQGILVDTRFLMYHYSSNLKENIMKLARAIENEDMT